MAKEKQEEAPKGSPAWMATFSDLMNLLLCFFVLLFSMSTVDAQKFEQIVASFKNNFSVLSASGNTVGDGVLISSGISVMEQFDEYFNTAYDIEGESDGEMGSEGASESDMANQLAEQYSDEAIAEAFKEQGLKESERMAQEIESLAEKFGIRQQMEVTFNGEYVEITLNGALLFDSGEAVVSPEGTALMDKLGGIIDNFGSNIVEVEGHTDNVPIHSAKFEDNEALSMYRAMFVAKYFRDITSVPDANIKSSGRGEFCPIADNTTVDGRAKNRRVEIKIYNSFNSKNAESR